MLGLPSRISDELDIARKKTLRWISRGGSRGWQSQIVGCLTEDPWMSKQGLGRLYFDEHFADGLVVGVDQRSL